MGPPPAPGAVTPAVASVAVVAQDAGVVQPEANNFNAQFTAVFPPTTATTMSTTCSNTSINNEGQQAVGAGPRDSQKHLNNLFETNYPDPFREQQNQGLIAGEAGGVVGMETPFSVGGSGAGIGGGSGAGTPTKGPVSSLAAGHHHRRNVSDTSAFNK